MNLGPSRHAGTRLHAAGYWALAWTIVFMVVPAPQSAAESAVRNQESLMGAEVCRRFDLPADDAAAAFRAFIAQSRVQLLYATDEIAGVRTAAVQGDFTPGEALSRLLAGTQLTAVVTPAGAIAIRQAGPVSVQAPPPSGIPASADYAVTVRSGGRSWTLPTYRSHARPLDKTIDPAGRYIKLSFLALYSQEPKPPEQNPDTYAHSWSQFDFSGGPVEVEVRVLRQLQGVTLPLRSAAVLPSALGIEAAVTGGDTIRFTLTRPAKIALVPNAREAALELAKSERKRVLEGYRNPLFLFARAPERDVPDKNAPGTLVIRPGEQATPAQFQAAKRVWFEPGVHDYSRFRGDEQFYMVLKPEQEVYLAGGAYVYGNFRSEVKRPIARMPLVRGRGTLSGDRQPWDGVPYQRTVISHVRLDGITIADPHNHIQHSTAPVRDVAIVGAWHGNTDGLTVEVNQPDPSYSGWHIDDCFVMAADTNLKLGGAARARRYVAWQLNNAEPVWIRNPNRCLVEDVHVIAFNNWPEQGGRNARQTVNLHGGRGGAKNTLVRNLTIEAPFAPLLFLLPAEDPDGPAFDNVIFENVVVRTPHIALKSPIGAARADGPRTGRIVFRNLVINGVRVTNDNCRDYFELRHGVTPGRELVFE